MSGREGQRVEFGIVGERNPDELHRGPMTGTQAQRWIDEWREMGGRRDAFLIVSRVVGEWEVCREADALADV